MFRYLFPGQEYEKYLMTRFVMRINLPVHPYATGSNAILLYLTLLKGVNVMAINVLSRVKMVIELIEVYSFLNLSVLVMLY